MFIARTTIEAYHSLAGVFDMNSARIPQLSGFGSFSLFKQELKNLNFEHFWIKRVNSDRLWNSKFYILLLSKSIHFGALYFQSRSYFLGGCFFNTQQPHFFQSLKFLVLGPPYRRS